MNKLAIAVTGASGSIYAQQFIEHIKQIIPKAELGLVFSKNAKDVWEHELENKSYEQIGIKEYELQEFTAPFASGSAGYDALVIIPCSMGTLGRIATGISNDLVTRAADVMLKERKKLICLVRETPYNLIHLKNMEAITLAGGIICPATPSFYSKPKSMEDACLTVVNRVISLLDLPHNGYQWGAK
jgi:flavin prenyltransferase